MTHRTLDDHRGALGEQSRARERGVADRVTLTGAVADPRPYYGAADAFVLPSLYDPSPTVAQEAMACGLAAVTSTKSGAAVLVREYGAGLVVESGDVAGPAAHLDALQDATTRARFASNARRAAHAPSPSAITLQRALLYRYLLTSAATSQALLEGINAVARELNSGDLYWLTYSGHGGQVPDINGKDDREHSYQPTPQDLSRAVEADLIFINGAGLEGYIQPLLENTAGIGPIVDVSDGVPLIAIDSVPENVDETQEDGSDPHTWTDPNNVKIWVENISQALIGIDASHTDYYQNNAHIYSQKLDSLDNWISEQVIMIPPQKRKLLFDHHVFGYFAKRYGFDVIGAIIPSFSTLAEPSAQEMAGSD